MKRARLMKNQRFPRFQILDAMTMFIPIGVGLWLMRWLYADYGRYMDSQGIWASRWGENTWIKSYYAGIYLCWILTPFTPAFVVREWIQLWPVRRELYRRAGFQANLAVCAGWAAWFINSLGDMQRNWEPGYSVARLSEYNTVISIRIAPFVVATWLATAAAGARRSSSDWVDRAGRIIGWAWILIWLFMVVIHDHFEW